MYKQRDRPIEARFHMQRRSKEQDLPLPVEICDKEEGVGVGWNCISHFSNHQQLQRCQKINSLLVYHLPSSHYYSYSMLLQTILYVHPKRPCLWLPVRSTTTFSISILPSTQPLLATCKYTIHNSNRSNSILGQMCQVNVNPVGLSLKCAISPIQIGFPLLLLGWPRKIVHVEFPANNSLLLLFIIKYYLFKQVHFIFDDHWVFLSLLVNVLINR